MAWTPSSLVRWLFDSGSGPSVRRLPRRILPRGPEAVRTSTSLSPAFQVRGLIGPQGLLPASEYLKSAAQQIGYARHWYVPSVLWISSGSHMLMALCWIGMAA